MSVSSKIGAGVRARFCFMVSFKCSHIGFLMYFDPGILM